MNILDLIKKSARILNVEQILEDDSLDDFSMSEEETILSKNSTLSRMFELAKLVINEVASYLPIIAEEELSCVDNKISITKFKNFEKVVSVRNKHGEYVKFCVRDNYLHLDQDGVFDIVYQQHPLTDGLLYPINNANGSIADDMLIAGLNAYYCLATGLYAEYNVYNAQYVDRLSRIKNLKVFSMPSRRWNG